MMIIDDEARRYYKEGDMERGQGNRKSSSRLRAVGSE